MYMTGRGSPPAYHEQTSLFPSSLPHYRTTLDDRVDDQTELQDTELEATWVTWGGLGDTRVWG